MLQATNNLVRTGTLQSFVPKLVLIVDSEDGGLPINVNLAPETRRALEELVARQRQGLATPSVGEATGKEHVPAAADNTIDVDIGHTSQEGNDDEDLPPLLEIPGGGIRRKRRDRYIYPCIRLLECFTPHIRCIY